MGRRLERYGEVGIVDEVNGFGMEFFEKTESRVSTMPSLSL